MDALAPEIHRHACPAFLAELILSDAAMVIHHSEQDKRLHDAFMHLLGKERPLRVEGEPFDSRLFLNGVSYEGPCVMLVTEEPY